MQKTWKKSIRTDNIMKKFHSVEITKLKYITFFILTPLWLIPELWLCCVKRGFVFGCVCVWKQRRFFYLKLILNTLGFDFQWTEVVIKSCVSCYSSRDLRQHLQSAVVTFPCVVTVFSFLNNGSRMVFRCPHVPSTKTLLELPWPRPQPSWGSLHPVAQWEYKGGLFSSRLDNIIFSRARLLGCLSLW